jgi:hypothetical protein
MHHKIILIMFLSILINCNAFSEIIDTCRSSNGATFEDYSNCLKVTISYISLSNRSKTNIKHSMRFLKRSLRYKYFKHCSEHCCANDTIVLDLLIAKNGKITNLTVNKMLSHIKDPGFCKIIIDEINKWNFGEKDFEYCIHLKKKFRFRKNNLRLALYFIEPHIIRFNESVN